MTFPATLRTTSFPSPGRSPHRRRRDERGVAFPSPLVMLSVLAVAMASITFIATRDQAPTERRVDTATIASAEQSPSVEPEPAPTETETARPEPRVKRGEVYVEVYNNSGISGLAGSTAARISGAGWQVVGSDNWYGTIPASTVYYPPRLEDAAKVLGRDIGITRLQPAVSPMRFDRLTVILTSDYA